MNGCADVLDYKGDYVDVVVLFLVFLLRTPTALTCMPKAPALLRELA